MGVVTVIRCQYNEKLDKRAFIVGGRAPAAAVTNFVHGKLYTNGIFRPVMANGTLGRSFDPSLKFGLMRQKFETRN